jgi:hypothetical protein
MLTSNTEILRRLGVLEQQWNDCQAEIEMRVKEKRVDNDGYLIDQDSNGNYSLVGKEFYYNALRAMVDHANKKVNCNRKE